jgi:hypothetical protein
MGRQCPWEKINTDIKRSSYTEKNCFEKSQNYFTNPISTVGL